MTTRTGALSSRLVLAFLALLCVLAAVIIRGNRRSATNNTRTISKATRMTKETTSNNMRSRSMVGGYSAMDLELLRSEEVLEIATFALAQHAAGLSPFGETFAAVSPEEAEGGAVQIKVLEAQRQVVAGLNYKLTLALTREDACLGAFRVTVYKPLPHMEQGLTVSSWGKALECDDEEVVDLLGMAKEGEEETALRVEEGRKEEAEEVEPDS